MRNSPETHVENSRLRVSVDLSRGTLSLLDRRRDRWPVTDAFSWVEWEDARGFVHTSPTTAACLRRVRQRHAGKNHLICLACGAAANSLELSLEYEISERSPLVLLRLSVRNVLSEPVHLRRLGLLSIEASSGGILDLGSSIRKWGFFGEGNSDLKPFFLINEIYQRGEFLASTMASAYSLATGNALTAGFTTTADQAGYIELLVDRETQRFSTFRIYTDMEGIVLPPGETARSEELSVNVCEEAESAILAYADVLRRRMRARRCRTVLTGWSTWDYYHANMCEEDILKNMEFLREHRHEFPVEYIQIDHGFQTADGNWQEWDPVRFPHGPRWMADQIRKHGFKPALWTVPLMVGETSTVYRQHPEWVVGQKSGAAVTGGGYGSRKVFALDGTRPEVRRWLRGTFRTIVRTWGYRYIKVDGANCIGINPGVRKDPSRTRVQAYRMGMEAVRDGMGKKAVLMGGSRAPSIGIVDMMRIGSDVGARWDWSGLDVHSGERDRYHGSGYIKRTIMSTLNSQYMHNRYWTNDPDYLIVRQDRSELSLNEARMWLTVIGLTGTTAILGDNMTTLSRERLDMLRTIFPIYGKAGRPLGFLREEIPSIIHLPIRKKFENWNVVAVLNTGDETATKSLDLARLGLAKAEYHVFEFWTRSYLGRHRDSVLLKDIPPHTVRLLAVRRHRAAPQILSTDMHITQGAVELRRWEFAPETRVLAAVLQAPGSREGRVFLHVPEPWKVRSAVHNGKKVTTEKYGQVVSIRVAFQGETVLKVRF